jgi:hypothetical protein
MSIVDGTDGIDLNGIFLPTSEWLFAMVMNVMSYERVL